MCRYGFKKCGVGIITMVTMRSILSRNYCYLDTRIYRVNLISVVFPFGGLLFRIERIIYNNRFDILPSTRTYQISINTLVYRNENNFLKIDMQVIVCNRYDNSYNRNINNIYPIQ